MPLCGSRWRVRSSTSGLPLTDCRFRSPLAAQTSRLNGPRESLPSHERSSPISSACDDDMGALNRGGQSTVAGMEVEAVRPGPADDRQLSRTAAIAHNLRTEMLVSFSIMSPTSGMERQRRCRSALQARPPSGRAVSSSQLDWFGAVIQTLRLNPWDSNRHEQSECARRTWRLTFLATEHGSYRHRLSLDGWRAAHHASHSTPMPITAGAEMDPPSWTDPELDDHKRKSVHNVE